MRVEAQSAENVDADVVVVPVAEGGEPPAGADVRVRELISSREAGTEFGEIGRASCRERVLPTV